MMLAKEGVAFVTTVKHKASEDEILFEKLKELRINIAHAAGLPAYVVFTDSTLHAMCRLLPANLKQFLEVPGVGEFKAQNYSEAFLDCITKHLGESEKIL